MIMPVRDSPLLANRLLVLAAHPDDESLGACGLLQRSSCSHVVFCTSGEPLKRSASYGALAQAREKEAQHALETVQVLTCTFLRFYDQQLYLVMNDLFHRVLEVALTFACDGVLTHALEVGHPDHDACAVIGRHLADTLNIPVWEMPLYHKDAVGLWHLQTFRTYSKQEWILHLSGPERETKLRALACYQSQSAVTKFCDVRMERFREQSRCDLAFQAAFSNALYAVSDVNTNEVLEMLQTFRVV